MICRLYIGNLNDDISKEDLKEYFSNYGSLKKCWFGTMDRGFAFIEYYRASDALNAINAMNGSYIARTKIKVAYAKPKEDSNEVVINGIDEKKENRSCYFCKEFGHIKRDCPSLKNVTSLVNVPSHWPLNPSRGQRVKVKKGVYGNIERRFEGSIGENVTVINIEEICNVDYYQKYEMQKKILQKKLCNVVNEKTLYHGTDPKIVDSICAQNFDFRLCGKNATAYGKGSYFAANASYSHKYSPADYKGVRHMFLATVLVGKYTLGNSTLTRPPQLSSLPGKHELYDSCVNNIHQPDIFVIFEQDQCYPKYLISYKLRETRQLAPINRSTYQNVSPVKLAPINRTTKQNVSTVSTTRSTYQDILTASAASTSNNNATAYFSSIHATNSSNVMQTPYTSPYSSGYTQTRNSSPLSSRHASGYSQTRNSSPNTRRKTSCVIL